MSIVKKSVIHISYHTHSLQSQHSVMQLLKVVQDMEYVYRVCLLIIITPGPEVLAVLWNYTTIKTDLFSTCHIKQS